jgi:hypothetical protein
VNDEKKVEESMKRKIQQDAEVKKFVLLFKIFFKLYLKNKEIIKFLKKLNSIF